MTDEHARLSPSASERWMKCPAAPDREAAYPDSPSAASSKGTRAHSLLEKALVDRQLPATFAGTPGIDKEMIEAVQAAVHLVAGLKYGSDQMLIEQRVDAGVLIGRDDIWGTSDVLIHHRRSSSIICLDYKHGIYPVEPHENPQLMIYTMACAGLLEAAGAPKIEHFITGVIQPRTRGPALRTWDFDRARMDEFKQELQQGAAATDSHDAPAVPDPKGYCHFCRAKPDCAEYALATQPGANTGIMGR